MRVNYCVISTFALSFLASGLSLKPASHSLSKRADAPESPESPESPPGQDLETRIDRFLSTLRTFVSYTAFDAVGFNSCATTLAKEMEELRNAVEGRDSVPTRLQEKLEFTKDKFREMLTSCDYKLKFQQMGDAGDMVVNGANELNIMLLNLQDSVGNPDPNVPNYDAILSRYQALFTYLGVQRGRLRGLPNITEKVIEFVFNCVGENLTILQASRNQRSGTGSNLDSS